jgi:hypothetical protein
MPAECNVSAFVKILNESTKFCTHNMHSLPEKLLQPGTQRSSTCAEQWQASLQTLQLELWRWRWRRTAPTSKTRSWIQELLERSRCRKFPGIAIARRRGACSKKLKLTPKQNKPRRCGNRDDCAGVIGVVTSSRPSSDLISSNCSCLSRLIRFKSFENKRSLETSAFAVASSWDKHSSFSLITCNRACIKQQTAQEDNQHAA